MKNYETSCAQDDHAHARREAEDSHGIQGSEEIGNRKRSLKGTEIVGGANTKSQVSLRGRQRDAAKVQNAE